MGLKLHRCGTPWKFGPCWRVQKALDEQRIPYEVVKGPWRPKERADVIEGTGETLFPAIEFEHGGTRMRVCIVGASGKLGQYMVQHALDRGYEVVGVCRQESVGKLDRFKGRITVIPGATDDPEVIKRAVAGCDGVLVVMTPVGVNGYSTGTTQAVLDYAPPGARLVFSCGWHITRDGQDVYSWKLKVMVNVFGRLARLARKSTSTTRWRHAGGCLPATPGGQSCAAATSRRAKARACPCGAST